MKAWNWIISGIFIFAVIGLGSYLINNPGGLFKQILFMAGVIAAIFVIYRIWTNRTPGGREKNAFAKAAKQSKMRAKRKKSAAPSSNLFRNRPLRRRSTAHLTVIEGKKGKKKDRAIF
ncbi:SA1362 family protein [Siminovitchia sediminis]|uniref:SA1362 family protein n=1 Tax=Siminovitchia sediminis TaxID=1274353 RepID=A0ABW4KHS6_9BACI